MRAAPLSVVLLVALALSSCGGSSEPPARTTAAPPPVRIGTMNFPESAILGELYTQALEAKGLRVDLQSAVGPREVTNRVLRSGSLDMYPEYVGVLLSEVHKIEKRPASPQAAYELAKSKEERLGFTLLDRARLSNENAIAVRKAFGARHDVKSISDLKRLQAVTTLGISPEFPGRFEGLVGLRQLYGLKSLKTTVMDIAGGEQYPKLDSGEIDGAVVFTTDSRLAGGRYTVLSDPKGVFAKQNVVPVISKKALRTHGPVLAATINAVSALLTTTLMQELNAKAAEQSPRQVADEFLSANDLKPAPVG